MGKVVRKKKKKGKVQLIRDDFNVYSILQNCNTDENSYNLNGCIEENSLYVINDKSESQIGDLKRRPSNLNLVFASEEISDDMEYFQQEDTWK